MKKVLVITLKGDIKYSFGIDKPVTKVLKEIESCKKPFYQVCETCAILINEIVSVESYDYKEEE